MSRERRRLEHVPALDGLRGVAVLVVVLYHTRSLANIFTGQITTARHFGWVNDFANGGFLGVDIFFVLSGFLITALLLGEHDRTGGVGLGGFYRRRAFRLLPALVVLLVALLVYTAWAGTRRPDLSFHKDLATAAAALTYVFNYVLAFRPESVNVAGFSHLWSLAVEEQFYLVWPSVLLVLLRRRAQIVPAIIIGAIVAIAVNRALAMPHHLPRLYIRTDTRADSLLVGALLAWLWTRGWVPRFNMRAAAWWATGLIIAMIATSLTTTAALYYGGFTVFAVAVGVIILAIVEADWGAPLRWKPLRTVGLVSYGLYLWHVPIFIAVNWHGPRNEVARIATGYALAALATWLSWVLIERRAIAFGRGKAPGRNRGQEPDSIESR